MVPSFQYVIAVSWVACVSQVFNASQFTECVMFQLISQLPTE